ASLEEKPRHRVAITRPFYLGKYEVTQAQYEEVTGTNPSSFRADGRRGQKVGKEETGQYPVDSVSWLDAVKFCNALSERHWLTPYYRIEGERVTVHRGTGYRLPTEAEWEYACRAGTDTRWPHADDPKDLGKYAWFA